MSTLRTPDGQWEVRAVELDGRPEFKVTRFGCLASCGPSNRLKDMGRCFSVAEVVAALGPEAFAQLETV